MRASDEDIEVDPACYDCETCPLADALATLEIDQANVRAWWLYRQVATRFSVDAHACALVLNRLTAEDEPETFADLLQRLAVLYDILQPPPDPANR